MNKSENIHIKVTPTEKANIVSNSAKSKLTISEYIIRSATNKDIIVIDGLDKVSTELRRIGNNINQLTRLANSRIINCVELEETKKELSKIWLLLNSLIIK